MRFLLKQDFFLKQVLFLGKRPAAKNVQNNPMHPKGRDGVDRWTPRSHFPCALPPDPKGGIQAYRTNASLADEAILCSFNDPTGYHV